MSTAAPSTLQVNLVALDRVDPELGQRLRWSVLSDHVLRRNDGSILLQTGATTRRLEFPTDALVQRLHGKESPERAILLGIGLGESVDTALRFWSETTVVAWDRDPWMMRILLSRRDFTRALLTRRLQLRLGPDLLDVEAGPEDKLVRHPVLESVYSLELEAWAQARPRRIVLMCTRGLFVKDVAEELQARGYVPWRVEVERVDVGEFERTVRKVAPAFAVAINQTVGLPEALDNAGIPLITWEIDPAVDWLPQPERAVPHSHLFTFRRQVAQQLSGSGHGSVTWLPLAAPEHRRPLAYTDEDRAAFAADVSFVGSSLVGRARGYAQTVGQQIRAWLEATGQAADTAEARLQAVLEHQRAQPDVWCLPAGLESHCPGFRAWCENSGLPTDPLLLLGELPAAEHRLQVVAALAPFGVHVWGDPGWNALQVPGVERRGFAGHLHALTRIYGLSRINIDIGRLYQPDIVTMRVFDVLACGGFLLAAHSEELGDLFELGVEVESWSSREELVDKVRHYLARPDAAQQIAERGRRAVRERHQVAQRVGRMLEIAGLSAAQSE